MPIYADRYEEIRNLGKGSNGVVVLVKDKKTGQNLALKLLKKSFGTNDRTALNSFKNEFAVLMTIKHPGIACVYDAGFEEETERYFITAEFVEGTDLYQATENLTYKEREDLFIQALRTLNFLHQRGIHHYDIKPQNFLVTEIDGKKTLKLIDFGFANFFEGKKQQEGQGGPIFVGTAAFIAPEMIQKGKLDHRADLYSLACTFYKVFTRELPFPARSEEEAYQMHVDQTPNKPSEILKKSIEILKSYMGPGSSVTLPVCTELPEYIDHILLKLLEKKPDDRYSSAQEVIEDINLYTGDNPSVETHETSMSYLEQGKLIGREEAFGRFKEIFNDRLYHSDFSKKPFLVVIGDEGVGKTRFLKECQTHAQKNFIKVFMWSDFLNLSDDEISFPCLVVGDEVSLCEQDLEYLEIGFKNEEILAVLTTTQKEIPCDPEHIVKLGNFTKEQTLEYLKAATGFRRISENIIDIIFKHTHGTPVYVVEYVRALFEHGFFKDAHGSWSQKMIDDLGVDLEKIGVAEFIKKRLIEKIQKADLSDFQKQLLYMMALTGKPTLSELSNMTKGKEIEDELKGLVDQSVLAVDSEHRFVFDNPIYKDILMGQMPEDEKAAYCDEIASYLKGQGEDEELILYFRGRGKSPDANLLLLELARQKRAQMFYKDARENILEILKKTESSEPLYDEAILEIGGLCDETGEYEEAGQWLNKILETDKKHDGLLMAKTYRILGNHALKRAEYSQAKECYLKALGKIQGLNNKWMEIILRGKLAQTEFSLGDTDQSKKLADQVWREWQERLNEQEKILSSGIEVDLVYFSLDEHKLAEQTLLERLKLVNEQSEPDVYPRLLYRLARSYLQTGQKEEGEELLKKTLVYLKQKRKTHILFAIYNELGIFYNIKGDLENSYTYLKHAFDLARVTSKGKDAFVIAYNIAVNRANFHLWDEAEKYYKYVLKNLHYKENEDDYVITLHLFKCALGLCDVYLNTNHKQAVQEFISKAEELLLKKAYLKPLAEYFWKEKIEVCHFLGDKEGERQARSQLSLIEKKSEEKKQS